MRAIARFGRPALLLVAALTCASAQSVVPLRLTGDPANRLDIVMMGDGYTASELGKFANDASAFLASAFAQEPFREYQQYFNAWRIDTPSAESGADHPERNTYRNTAFDATYFCGGIDRLLCVDLSKVYAVAGILPPNQRDTIIVIVNDPTYGGAGYFGVAVASTNFAVVEVVLHELGHSLGLLADEYDYSPPACFSSFEPPEANVTAQTSRPFIKWGHWIDPSTSVPTTAPVPAIPGLYQGARYCPANLYRPTYDSKMRSLGQPFDQINTEQLIRQLYSYVSPIDSVSPTSASISVPKGNSSTLSVTTPLPQTHSLTVTWRVDGVVRGSGKTFVLDTSGLSIGQHAVSVTVSDGTSMVRNDPSQVLVETANWTVVVTGAAPTDLNSDGRVDCNDLAIVKAAFGKRLGQPGYNPAADVNGDGLVDIRDLAILSRSVPPGTICQ